ncbi:pilin polypeptide [Clostridium sp. CAG:768]|nr:pilin polypeptide [Clostridium sp. CAG:768]
MKNVYSRSFESAPPPRSISGSKAFTLAEVLITLGIIGVVAALTIPTLIQNHKKHVIEVKLKTFYTIMNQAVQKSELDYGDKSTWNETGGNLCYGCIKANPLLSDEQFFDKYLGPNLTVIDHKKIPQPGIADFQLDTYTLKNGLQFSMYEGGAIYWLFTDTKTQKILGKNAFTFAFIPRIEEGHKNLWIYHENKGIEPFAYGFTNSYEYNMSMCKKDNKYCTKLIQMNNWKIPKDYPIRF